MSFFRDYLTREGQRPDYQFDESDENWFVFALFLLRLGFPLEYWNRIVGRGKRFRGSDPIRSFGDGPESRSALLFVSRFLCFFVPKPQRYRREISSFKQHFIPKFGEDYEKQELLFNSALPSFSRTPVEQATWGSVGEYFKWK